MKPKIKYDVPEEEGYYWAKFAEGWKVIYVAQIQTTDGDDYLGISYREIGYFPKLMDRSGYIPEDKFDEINVIWSEKIEPPEVKQ